MDTLVLRAVAHELDSLLRGSRVRRAGLLNERELGLVLTEKSGREMLVLAVEPGVPHLRLQARRALSRRLTDQLGEAASLLAGAQISRIEPIGFERVLHLALEPHPGRETTESSAPDDSSSIDIFFELLPRTPFLVITSGEKIVAAIRAPGTSRPDDRRMERGRRYHLPFGLGPPAEQPPVRGVLTTRLVAVPEVSADRWAEALAPLYRGVEPQRLAALLTGARDLSEAAACLTAYRGPVRIEPDPDGVPRLVAGAPPGEPDCSATAESTSRPAAESAAQPAAEPTALAAMAEWAKRGGEHQRTLRLRTDASRALSGERGKIRRALSRLARDRDKAGDAGTLRRLGEALLAHLGEVPRGVNSVELPDPYGGAERIEIRLDPRRTPAANAEDYFNSARRAERAARHLAAREEALAETDHRLAAAEERLAATDDDGLAALVAGLAADGLISEKLADAAAGPASVRGENRPTGSSGKPVRLPYRSYDLGGGWEIRVGRTNADNDVLTHKLARPHDLWFHVHGATGSHVILRRSDGSKGQPAAAVLEAAAASAAFFSRARHSRLVPVIVTEKRYVRKPRGSPPGTAVCLREKTMMVEPARPGAAEPEEGSPASNSAGRGGKPRR
jgi:predicted ribosome quality control (RQC) complex YloA/Tae2 family protein